ncbi:hypothetical protein BCCR75501_06949 [Burkholderia sola]|nr:hypothetical protein BCCR75501_06949 [Burkholderia cenocepacia]
MGEGRAADTARRLRGRAPQAPAVAGLSVRADASLAAGTAHRARAAGRVVAVDCSGGRAGRGRHRARCFGRDRRRAACIDAYLDRVPRPRADRADRRFLRAGRRFAAGRARAHANSRAAECGADARRVLRCADDRRAGPRDSLAVRTDAACPAGGNDAGRPAGRRAAPRADVVPAAPAMDARTARHGRFGLPPAAMPAPARRARPRRAARGARGAGRAPSGAAHVVPRRTGRRRRAARACRRDGRAVDPCVRRRHGRRTARVHRAASRRAAGGAVRSRAAAAVSRTAARTRAAPRVPADVVPSHRRRRLVVRADRAGSRVAVRCGEPGRHAGYRTARVGLRGLQRGAGDAVRRRALRGARGVLGAPGRRAGARPRRRSTPRTHAGASRAQRPRRGGCRACAAGRRAGAALADDAVRRVPVRVPADAVAAHRTARPGGRLAGRQPRVEPHRRARRLFRQPARAARGVPGSQPRAGVDRTGARLRDGRARAPGLSVRKAGRALRGPARHVADAAVPGGVLDAGGAGPPCADRRAGRRVRGHAGNGNRIRPDDEPASRRSGLRRRAADARPRAGAWRGRRGDRTVPGRAGPAADAAGRCAARRRGRAVGRTAAGLAGGVRGGRRVVVGGVRPRVAAVGHADGRQRRAGGRHRARDAQLRGAAGPGGAGCGRAARARRPRRRARRAVLADGARRTGGAARRAAHRGDVPAARSRRAGRAAARDPVASGAGAARARRDGAAADVARMRGDRVRRAWRRVRRRAARTYRSATGRLYAVHVRFDRRAEGRRRQPSGGRAEDPGTVRRVSHDGRRPGRAVLVARVRRVDRGNLHDAVRRRLSAAARAHGVADARRVQRPARRTACDRAQPARVVLARMGACDRARRGRAAGAAAAGRDGQRDGAARGRADMARRDGRPRGADERVRADGERDHVRRARRAGRRARG